MRDIKHNIIRTLACLLACCVCGSVFSNARASEMLVSAPLIIRKDSSNGMVRVYLSSLGNPGTLNITVSGSYTINGLSSQQLANGTSIAVGFNSNTGSLTLNANGTVTSMGNAFKLRRHSLSGTNGLKIQQARASGNLYPGDLSFTVVASGGTYKLYTIAYVFIEDYLYGVLPYEMGGSAPMEALKAQAVTARTYTLKAMSAAGSRRYDVVDTTGDQVYSGTPSGSSACKSAVDATRGIVAMNGGSFAATYYTASNGGQVESVKNLWGSSAYGYITVKDDPYDYSNPDSRVRTYAVSSGSVQNAALAQLLQAKVNSVLNTTSARIIAIKNIVMHTPKYPVPSRLYTKIDFYVNATAGGTSKDAILTFNVFTELEAPLAMGINTAANELWTVTRTDSGFQLKARRYGHGTGLSQRGAMYMAKLGYTYAQILAFYFEGCSRVQYSLISSILSPIVIGTDSIELTATQTPAALPDADPCTAIVSLSSSTFQTALRSTAQDNGSVITMLKQGAEASVFTISDTWCLIKYGELCGYVKKAYLAISGVPSGNIEEVTRLSGYGVVTGTNLLNLRKSQSMSAAILAQIPRSTILPLISVSSEWAYVQFGRLAGYVYLNLLTQYSQYPVAINDSSPGAMVNSTTGSALLRMTPGNNSYVISQLADGTLVSVKYDDGSWCRVVHGGVTGYILSGDLTYTDQPVDESEDMIGEGEFAATANPESSTLNLRLAASTTAEVIGEIPKGDKLIVAQQGPVWCAVRYRGVPGFVMTQYILLTPVSDVPVANARVHTVSGSLNLRASASITAAVLITIPYNTVVPVYNKGSQWSRVSYNGRTGYVLTSFLIFLNDPTASPAVISTPSPAPTILPTLSPTQTITADPTASATPAIRTAKVNTSSGSLNLRMTASAFSKVLTTIPQKTIVDVLSKGSEWTKVKYYGYTGYCMTKFLLFTIVATPTPGPTATPQAPPSWMKDGGSAKVNTISGSLNLRSSPSTIARVVIAVPQYSIVTVKTAGAPWCSVTYGEYIGYVMTRFLAAAEESVTDEPVLPPEETAGPLPESTAGI